MSVHVLVREQTVARPLEEVFAFFSRPENLSRITPGELGFRILTPSPVPMHRGAVIDYVVRPFGLPLRWRSLITDFDPPHRFVDEQLRGPYDLWHHAHSFIETDEGTRIRDEVHYALPLGPLGRLVHALAVRRRLEIIFDHRARAVAEFFESEVRP
jgi:ligand-binding SRPBCC domain-containing protein